MHDETRTYLEKHRPESGHSWLDMPEPKNVARPVWLTKAPWPVDSTMQDQNKALEVLFGENLQVVNKCGKFIVYTAGEVCDCGGCSVELQRVIDTTQGLAFSDTLNGPMNRMILCPECGNKRCPRATFHDHQCTGSNDPGQQGSSYR